MQNVTASSDWRGNAKARNDELAGLEGYLPVYYGKLNYTQACNLGDICKAHATLPFQV